MCAKKANEAEDTTQNEEAEAIDPVMDDAEESLPEEVEEEDAPAQPRKKAGRAKAADKIEKYTPPSEEACKKPGKYKLPSGITAVNA